MPSLVESIGNLFSSIVGVITSIINSIFAVIQSFVNIILGIFGTALDAVGTTLKGLGNTFSGLIAFVLSKFLWAHQEKENEIELVRKLIIGDYLDNFIVIGSLVAAFVVYSVYVNRNGGRVGTTGQKKTI